MSDHKDVTSGFVDGGLWVHPPTPGTPSYRLVDPNNTGPEWLHNPEPGTAAARLMEQSEAEVYQEPSGTGLQALAWAQDRIEGKR